MDQEIMISSNSWGPDDNGLSFNPAGPLVTKTLQTGALTVNLQYLYVVTVVFVFMILFLLQGRNGKGTIYVWASGNGGGEGSHDSCSSNGFINSIYTIGIGSAEQNGFQAEYDENCTSKMAVTFSYYSKQRTSDQLVLNSVHAFFHS